MTLHPFPRQLTATRMFRFTHVHRSLACLGSLLLCAVINASAQTGSHPPADRCFRALVIACDLPEGLQLTIDDRRVPVTYSSSKVTNLSAFRPGSYMVEASAPGCLPLRQQLVLKAGRIHTWVFYTVPHPVNGASPPADTAASDPTAGKSAPTRALMLRDLSTPTHITEPATVVINLTGPGDSLNLLLDGQPIKLPPMLPTAFPARKPGATLEIAEREQPARPFFTQQVHPGNHAIVAIFRRLDGQLSAIMKTL